MTTSDKKLNTNDLINYINKRKCNPGDKLFTHTWFENKNRFIFKILDEEYDNFLEIYCKNHISKNSPMHILEKQRDIGPFCLDFDIKHEQSERLIATNEIVIVIELINRIILKYFKLSDSQEQLTSYVLMKNEPMLNTSTNKYADGFHIQYPNLILSAQERYLIYDEAKQESMNNDYFHDLHENIEDTVGKSIETLYDSLFDKATIKTNSWFMYGSGKKIGNLVNLYKLKYIFDLNVDEISIIPKDSELVKLLAIRNKIYKNVEYIGIDSKLDVIKNKYIKSELKNNVDKLFIKNPNFSADENIENKSNRKSSKLIYEDEHFDKNIENINIAKKLIKLLSKNRADSYYNWILVGWALYNISPSLLQEFIIFSKQCPEKYTEGCCEKVWIDCAKYENTCGYNIASLYRWSKEDNLNGYQEFIKEKINKILENGDIKTDFDIACIIKEIYKYDYICSSISKNIWWQFDNHKWNNIDSAYTLSLKMSTEVAKDFAKLSAYYMIKSTGETGQKSDFYLKKSNDIGKLIQDLKKGNYKDKIINECAKLFYDPEFESKLNQNNYLVGFTNGIYDLKNKLFRNGCPDDYVSKTTGYKYIEFKHSEQIIIDIKKFFTSIQPQEDMRQYILCYCASLLEGGNKDQKFMIWTGSGSNSKGTLIDLLDNVFGEYFGTLPVTLLTQKRKGTSNATPELADKFGVRCLTLQEPEEDDKINIGFMKELTGQDKIMARPLYGDPFYYIPQFKILLACNKLPTIPSDDGGTWRRIRVIDFAQRFVTNPTLPNEQKIDPVLREKIKTWNQALIWLLINEYYPLYSSNGLDSMEPESVKLSTSKYKQDSNIYIEFMTENFETAPKESMPKEYVWAQFKDWYSNTYSDKKPPPMKKLIEFFQTNNYKIIKGNIMGIKSKDVCVDNMQLGLDNM